MNHRDVTIVFSSLNVVTKPWPVMLFAVLTLLRERVSIVKVTQLVNEYMWNTNHMDEEGFFVVTC